MVVCLHLMPTADVYNCIPHVCYELPPASIANRLRKTDIVAIGTIAEHSVNTAESKELLEDLEL